MNKSLRISAKVKALRFFASKKTYEFFYKHYAQQRKALGKSLFYEILEKKEAREFEKITHVPPVRCKSIEDFFETKKRIIYCLTYGGEGGDWITNVKEVFDKDGNSKGIYFSTQDERANNYRKSAWWAAPLLNRLIREYNYSVVAG